MTSHSSRLSQYNHLRLRHIYHSFLVSMLSAILSGQTAADALLPVGKFSAAPDMKTLPADWQPLHFESIENHTRYELVMQENSFVVKATSNNAASALAREVTIDPKEYPIVQWRWKIENVLRNGDVTKKSGDDYPARLYITFAYDSSKAGLLEKARYEAAKILKGEYPPGAAVAYIWESKSPIGTRVPNPYTDRVHMFVTRSGAANSGQWISEERNVYEDYRLAFGENPPAITGIAIMTDTDNTGESAVAYYGDIFFKRADEAVAETESISENGVIPTRGRR